MSMRRFRFVVAVVVVTLVAAACEGQAPGPTDQPAGARTFTYSTTSEVMIIWDPVKRIETPDDRTLVFELSYPSPLDLVAAGTYSAFIYDTEATGGQDLADWFADGNDAGTGPYTVSEYNPGEEIELRLEAFPDYWGGWDGPHYERYVFRVTPEATTASQQLQAREATLVQRLSPQLWESFRDREGFETTSAPSWQTLLAMLNTESGPLSDERVREAVSLAIDYQGIMAALEGAAQPLSGYVP